MVVADLHTDALRGLCPKDQLDLLDSVDRLRSQGISHYVSLPQIIVCGDQSAGKSSVLEAISGVSFPVKSTLCTRFPTELVLRSSPLDGVSVSIVPHHSRTESEKTSLSGFNEKLENFDGFPSLVDKAKAAMGISTHGKAFSKDLLRVEITGPGRPHLTIVDLPGLIHSETKQQSASDVELIQDVVKSYMKEPRSIILAVVSAKNDYANQIVLKLARAADATGHRTLGVITKPDTLTPGSETEALYACLARNQDVEFRLGWHVLKNMDSETGRWSLAHRNVEEAKFLSQGIWSDLPRSLAGIERLRSRLSDVLLCQIAAELPGLVNEIQAKIRSSRAQLDQLGQPRATLDEQRLYLLNVSQHFQSLVKASVDGTYNNPFFGDAMSEPGYQKRFRAVVQNLNRDFAKHLAGRGHRRQIIRSKNDKVLSGVIAITRDDFVDEIQELMQRTRGPELPGTYNPMVVANLFATQSGPWEKIVRKHVDKVWVAAKGFLGLVVAHVADIATSPELLRKIVEPQLEIILDGLRTSSAELLKPHQESHPITYNHYFTENLQKIRNKRLHDQFTTTIRVFFRAPDDSSLESVPIDSSSSRHMDMRPLLENLLKHTEPDMNRFGASEALDCLEAYYQVAMKRFIDDIAIQVIELKLVAALGEIFSPVKVASMDSNLVTLIAGESEETRTAREELTKQLAILQAGYDTCKSFISVRLPGSDLSQPFQIDSGVDDETLDASSQSKNSDDSSDDVWFCRTKTIPMPEPPPRPMSESETECVPHAEPELPVEPELVQEDFDSLWAAPKKSKKKKGKITTSDN